MTLTFKRQKAETGLRAVGHPTPDVDIKLKGKVVGYLKAPSWEVKGNKWRISLAKKKPVTKEDPCEFKWIRLKAEFASEEEAREFVKTHAKEIVAIGLHQLEE